MKALRSRETITARMKEIEDDIDEDMFEIPKAPWYEFRWLDRLV